LSKEKKSNKGFPVKTINKTPKHIKKPEINENGFTE
jgi:hypothetical protein